MNMFMYPFNNLRYGLNYSFSNREPWQIVTLTASSVLAFVWLYDYLDQDEDIVSRLKKIAFNMIKPILGWQQKIDYELQKVSTEFKNDIEKTTKHLNYLTILPSNAFTIDDIKKLFNENMSLDSFKWREGRVSGAVYCYNLELIQLLGEIYAQTAYTNPLHPDIFPGLRKMEAEIVQIVLNLFHGDENGCGTVTTGGTESILMACKAYRDYAKAKKGIKKPEIVIPITAHSAFDKAAQYLKLKIKSVPIDPVTTTVDIKAMKQAINSNTIMLVGSAPNFPYGTIDDIEAISELGLKYNIPVHVDSCLGGFLTAFMDEAGYPVPICDFRLPGVTSISVDTHKYGYCPKGSSVILYREKKYRHFQYTVTTDWPGGVYGSPTVNGSRAGGNIAVCWATLLYFGRDHYVQITRNIIHTAKYIEKCLRRMNGIYIFGQPSTSVIAIGSNEFDIYRLSSALNKLGWNVNALQFPSGIHFCLTQVHTDIKIYSELVNDIQDSLNEILKNPNIPVQGRMAIYGVAQSLPDRSIVGDFTRLFLDSLYYTPKK